MMRCKPRRKLQFVDVVIDAPKCCIDFKVSDLVNVLEQIRKCGDDYGAAALHGMELLHVTFILREFLFF